jgi:hypothetical protein
MFFKEQKICFTQFKKLKFVSNNYKYFNDKVKQIEPANKKIQPLPSNFDPNLYGKSFKIMIIKII